MATEDIDLTWKLLLAGWHTAYEPRALVGMQVPSTLSALWAQRNRWARGQGEVLRAHLGTISRWRNRRLWLVSIESVASLIWVIALVVALTLAALALGGGRDYLGFGLAWGIAIAVIATVQLTVALRIGFEYDPRLLRSFLVGPLYPLAYWTIMAAAALRSQTVAVFRGPQRRVVWDVPREYLGPSPGAEPSDRTG